MLSFIYLFDLIFILFIYFARNWQWEEITIAIVARAITRKERAAVILGGKVARAKSYPVLYHYDTAH